MMSCLIPTSCLCATCADHYILFRSVDALTNLLVAGAEGPRWPLAEARRLLGVAQRALELSRLGFPKEFYNAEKAKLAELMVCVEGMAASFPGLQQLPALPLLLGSGLPPMQPPKTCAACGKEALILRACTGCHVVSYCSRECQVRCARGLYADTRLVGTARCSQQASTSASIKPWQHPCSPHPTPMQKRHWRAPGGGHKAMCAALAAARQAGRASGS